MSAPRLIVPSQYAEGKQGVRQERNPFSNVFARIVRSRQNANQKRYVGPVWRGVGPQADEHPGRPYGNTVSSWIDDLCQLRKVVLLCDGCQSRFDYKRAHYFRDERWSGRVTATCDGCREYTTRGRMYLPEERILSSTGVGEPGQCWVAK